MPSKTKKSRTWAENFTDLNNSAPREFDPEDHEPSGDESQSDAATSDSGSETFDGREHYVTVGKGKLRKPAEILLGPQYKGSRISRKELLVDCDGDGLFGSDRSEQDVSDQMDFESPDNDELETDDSDEEIDSDEASGGSDLEGPNDAVPRGKPDPRMATGKDIVEGSVASSKCTDGTDPSSDLDGVESGSNAESGQGSDLDDGFSGDNSVGGEEEEDIGNSHDEATGGARDEAFRRKELREMIAQEQKSVVASVSQSAKSDISKGRAVKEQRSAFDALLNTRIRLQKGLISTNSLSEHNPQESSNSTQNREAIRAAEEAAIRLWNVLDGLRDDIAKAHAITSKTGSKRKRGVDIISIEDMWSAMRAHESHFLQTRRTTLEKWSAKVRGPTTIHPSRKLNSTTNPQTITDVLREQLSNSERLVKRTRVPRSCAPAQAQKKIPEDSEIFDDADFYQILLKELVDQRMVESSNARGEAVQWTAVRDARTRKNIDTRASKGRKLRYTVHEKLQNFMAPQEVGSWGQRQIDELFSSLLGRRARLQEDDVDSADDEDCFGEEDLKLFRDVAR